MRKQSLILLNLLIIIVLLVGCGPVSFEAERKEPRKPLNVAEWPTPEPETTSPTATPFPKTTLVPTATPIAQTETASETTNPVSSDLSLSSNPTDLAKLAEQITALTGLPPVAAAVISVDKATVHNNPDASSELLDTLSQGDIAPVLGKDDTGDWLYVITEAKVQGWLPLDTLRLVGSLAKAPVLPEDQVDTATTEIASSSPSNDDDLVNTSDLGGMLGNQNPLVSLGLSPIGAAFIKNDEAAVRQGPSTAYGVAETLAQGEIAGVMGTDSSGDWFYVVTFSIVPGWVSADNLRIVGDLENAPVLPPDPVAAALARANAPASSQVSRPIVEVDDLESTITAQVNNVALNLRQRPGAQYKLLNTLEQGNEVTILALNRDKEWALVQTADQRLGWGSMDFLEVDGSLVDVPQLITLSPSDDHPADEVAPLASLSSSSVPIAVASSDTNTTSSVQTNTSPNAVTGSNSSVPGNTLALLTTAEVNTKVDLHRGPGTSHATVHTLTIDEIVSVYALNNQKNWALVEGTNARLGWTPLTNLTLAAPIANAPHILTAWVKSNDLETRRGPGIYYETVGKLGIHNLVSILALSEGRNWALVETLSGAQGWITLRFLDIIGSLADVPQIDAPSPDNNASNGPTPAAPSGPPSGKLVVQTASGEDIMLINADGSGLRHLTTGIDPVLSPDGRHVAFTRWVGDAGTLWVIDIDGNNERVILNEIRKAKGPDWSPDGSKIALNYQHGGRLEDAEVCRDFRGSLPNMPRNATNAGVRRDGSRVQFCFTIPPDEQWGLRVINMADGTFKDLYGGLYAFRPAWDPGRSWRLVSDSGVGLLAIDINRDEYREPLTNKIGDGSPVFSPDGQFIAVTTDVQGGYDIFRMNTNGGGRVRLTETPFWETVQPESDGQRWKNVAPTWSPDGSRLAFLTDRNDHWEIWLMNADGSEQRPMFSDEINNQLNISYNFVDERVLSWR